LKKNVVVAGILNGNNRDHRLENLRILCPNCHAQTPTYCSKNKNRLSEEKIKEIDGKRMAFLFQEIEGQVENKKVFPAKRKTIIDAEEVRKLGETFTTKEIAEQLGVPEGSLRKYLSAKKISIADKHKEKFSPTKEELEKLVNEKPMTELAKMFGVSDTAIKKRCKRLGIEIGSRRGYWAKLYAGKEVISPPNPNDRETIDFSSL
jgi:biotin operon repressor